MLIDLKAHYLDLLVTAIEKMGNACLHRPDVEPRETGVIYVTKSETDTRAEYVIQYSFDEQRAAFGVEFADGRPKFAHLAPYVRGMGEFFPLFMRALKANRLEYSANTEKEVAIA